MLLTNIVPGQNYFQHSDKLYRLIRNCDGFPIIILDIFIFYREENGITETERIRYTTLGMEAIDKKN
jgi:hypothetical protein